MYSTLHWMIEIPKEFNWRKLFLMIWIYTDAGKLENGQVSRVWHKLYSYLIFHYTLINIGFWSFCVCSSFDLIRNIRCLIINWLNLDTSFEIATRISLLIFNRIFCLLVMIMSFENSIYYLLALLLHYVLELKQL